MTTPDELAEAEAIARVIAGHGRGGEIGAARMCVLLAEYDRRGQVTEAARTCVDRGGYGEDYDALESAVETYRRGAS